jgi:hypothetical protein
LVGKAGSVNAGDKKVEMAVIVIIPPGTTTPVAKFADEGVSEDPGKGAVAIVVIEGIPLVCSIRV